MAEYQWLAGLNAPDTSAWRWDFSRMGFALAVLMFVPQALYIALYLPLRTLAPGWVDSGVGMWLLTTAMQYLVGYPLAMLVLGRAPHPRGEGEGPLRPFRLFQMLIICLGGLYGANLVTTVLLNLLSQWKGSPVRDPLANLNVLFPPELVMLTACVLAPVFEEFFFRRLLLDRLRPYGPRFAVVASALAFGMLHGNLSQLPYAFVLGLLLGWLALRSCRLWQVILLHTAINLIGGNFLFTPLKEQGVLLLGLLILGSIIGGVALMHHYRSAFRLPAGTPGITEGQKWRLWFFNPGMLIFTLITLWFIMMYLA